MDKLFFNVSKSINPAIKTVYHQFAVWICLLAFMSIPVSSLIIRNEEKSLNPNVGASVDIFTNTSEPSHIFPCTPVEANKTRCLNKGKCLKTAHDAHSLTTFCKCTEDFSGEKCEEKAFPSINFFTAELMVGIGAGVAFLFIIVVFICVLCLFSIKKHKRDYRPWMEETNYKNKSSNMR